jgi:hypothetical protein
MRRSALGALVPAMEDGRQDFLEALGLVTNPGHLLRCALQIPAFAWSPKSNRSESNQTDPLGAMTTSIHLSSLFLRLPI